MIRCGISVNAQRPVRGSHATVLEWQSMDITELSDDEFRAWWGSIQDDAAKFLVADSLRKACISASDFGDSEVP